MRRAGIVALIVLLLSVVKLPVALVVLDGVDRGRWSLTTPIPLLPLDMHPRGWIGDRYPNGGGHLEIRRLLVEMLTRSDNSAADALMRVVGGPAAITTWLNEHGIHDLRVDRSERGLGNDWYGLPSDADTMGSAEAIRELRAQVPAAVHDSAARAMLLDPRDTGTAQACVDLIERLWRGDLLSPAMTDTLKALLARCKTGRDRLPGQLPKGTPVAHKTGTGGTTGGVTVAINDVGVIRLPNGEDVAIAVLVGEPRGLAMRADRLIARTARAVYDAWSVADSAGGTHAGPTGPHHRVRQPERLHFPQACYQPSQSSLIRCGRVESAGEESCPDLVACTMRACGSYRTINARRVISIPGTSRRTKYMPVDTCPSALLESHATR